MRANRHPNSAARPTKNAAMAGGTAQTCAQIRFWKVPSSRLVSQHDQQTVRLGVIQRSLVRKYFGKPKLHVEPGAPICRYSMPATPKVWPSAGTRKFAAFRGLCRASWQLLADLTIAPKICYKLAGDGVKWLVVVINKQQHGTQTSGGRNKLPQRSGLPNKNESATQVAVNENAAITNQIFFLTT